ncbi:uncharacterized protein LY79DRAFT_192901 [Colletotrichum navitas]|uniref:Uncharacterized protein n=1 Tax=Colletotrichum navitas TaxID=681940 RepID=A0AAD8Q095_9PEZI|nr:uncharacterized protein LY79DRAFT_192901 [Colletotrichum navitas]KAK1590844.1 hypothetical protein LY79DRAFT_192901 [Colletotrichum navitas]
MGRREGRRVRNNVSSKRPALSILAHKFTFIFILFLPPILSIDDFTGASFPLPPFLFHLFLLVWIIAFSSLISAHVISRTKMTCPFHDMSIGKVLRRPKGYRKAGNPL